MRDPTWVRLLAVLTYFSSFFGRKEEMKDTVVQVRTYRINTRRKTDKENVTCRIPIVGGVLPNYILFYSILFYG